MTWFYAGWNSWRKENGSRVARITRPVLCQSHNQQQILFEDDTQKGNGDGDNGDECGGWLRVYWVVPVRKICSGWEAMTR
jgi:hypothetical protein